MKRKNKKIILGTLVGISSICLTTACVKKAATYERMFYPAIVRSAVKDIKTKEQVDKLYLEKFKQTSLVKHLTKEFGEFKELSVIETKKDTTLEITFDAGSYYNDKMDLDEDRDVWKEQLSELYQTFYTKRNETNVRFDITVRYKHDDDPKEAQRTYETYRIAKNRFKRKSIAVLKTMGCTTLDSWSNEDYLYNIDEDDFVYAVYDVLDPVIDSYYRGSKHDLKPYEIEAIYEDDSDNVSFDLDLRYHNFSNNDPRKLMEKLLTEISSDKVNDIAISIEIDDDTEFYYSDLINTSNNTREYSFRRLEEAFENIKISK